MKQLSILLVIIGAALAIYGLKINNELVAYKATNISLHQKNETLKKELAALDRFPAQEQPPVVENFLALRDFVYKYSQLHGMESTVKIAGQKDFNPADKYVQLAGIPGVKKMQITISSKATRDNRYLATLVEELYKRFPMALEPIAAVDKTQSPAAVFTINKNQDNQMLLESTITLYGV